LIGVTGTNLKSVQCGGAALVFFPSTKKNVSMKVNIGQVCLNYKAQLFKVWLA